MNREWRWQVTLALVLVTMAALVYYIHFLVFRDAHHIFLYFIGDAGFVFFEVLLVTLVIHRLIHHRERKALRNRRNMLAGAFFSEAGAVLLKRLAAFDRASHRIAERLEMPEDWSEREFLNIREMTEKHDPELREEPGGLESLKDFLQEKKPFLLDLLQNPALMENEPFTNLVWAVFHLAEELAHRGGLDSLPEPDAGRIREDIGRVYGLLRVQWVEYMSRLKADSPYLFSLAVRRHRPWKKAPARNP